MPVLSGRRVQVTRYEHQTSVMLSWFEGGKTELDDMQSEHLLISQPVALRRMEEIVNSAVDKWARVFLSEGQMAVVSECLDANPKRFDWMLEMCEDDTSRFALITGKV